jgi:amino acid transporter, AAT family
MTTTRSEDNASTTEAAPPAEPARVPMFGPATPVVAIVAIFAVSIVTWWLIGDPTWSLSGAKADGSADAATKSAIVSCLLFWTIFGHIFTGFTFGNWPFTKLPQPLSGVAQVVVDLIIGILGTLLFTRVVGHWDPTFSAATAGGTGYTAAAFIVLIGFYAYAFASASLGGYPFESVPVPLASVAQWFMAAFITVIGVVWLVYPNFSAALAAHAPVSLPTAAGWVYSSIVIVIVAAMQWQNWPWAGIANRHLRSLAALVVTLGGGYVLMLGFKGLLHGILPGDIKDVAGFPFALEAAELGVCFSLWSLIFGLIVAPSKISSVAVARAVRTVIVAVLAILTYVVFMRFFATTVLHFPATRGNYGGNPLLWMDWTILLVLWYAVAFGGHLGTKRTRTLATPK